MGSDRVRGLAQGESDNYGWQLPSLIPYEKEIKIEKAKGIWNPKGHEPSIKAALSDRITIDPSCQ